MAGQKDYKVGLTASLVDRLKGIHGMSEMKWQSFLCRHFHEVFLIGRGMQEKWQGDIMIAVPP